MTEQVTTVWPGRPYPLGATWDGKGVNFALFSEHAELVELCLFDTKGRHEIQRIPIREQTDQIWHCYIPEARPGLFYGYRIYGPYAPALGARFNHNKLLLDPYAKAIIGPLRWSDAQFGYKIGHKQEDLSFDRRDSASSMPKCQVINTLENPEARERLIGQLKLLAKTQQEMARSQEKPTLGSTTVDLLKTLSDRLARSVETTVKAATMFHQIPRVAGWLQMQISTLDRRNLWLGVIENLAGIIGSAYLAFFICRWVLKPLREASERRPTEGFAMRISCLFVLLLLALLPIIAFAITGYMALGLIQPSENIRLVAIVWINAAVIVHLLMAINRFFLAPHYPQFRWLPVGDNTARYIDSWMQWLSITVTYGYFALQAALLIGMPLPLYETLLRLLGLLVSGLIILLILQNRQGVVSSNMK
ncbi:MAG: hypothetical protein PHD43_05805 [Methylococcales bacterium]|nr:hypothetical protein [Methylococcales bacterium]